MLYETLFQAKIFLSIMYFGIFSGLVFDVTHRFRFKKYFLSVLQDLIFMIIFSCIYIVSVHVFCFGEFRFYTIVAFVVGFLIERKTIGKFVALFLNMIYNICVKFIIKFKRSKIYMFFKNLFKKLWSKLNFIKKIKIKVKNKREKKNEGIL